VSQIAAFLDQATRAVVAVVPGLRPVPFGHIGDGNIHFNLSQPTDMDTETFLSRREEIAKLVHDIVVSMGGSISAEHGLGVAKRDEIRRYKSDVELAVMKSLKQALDPQGILNPGKVV
jgi:FAD/FMN-containing dehydrogenase